mgnify:CR=1 FL=1
MSNETSAPKQFTCLETTPAPPIYFFDSISLTTITGASLTYLKIRNFELDKGRVFSHIEEEGSQRVAVLGAEVVKQLFPNSNPIGERIRIKKVNFTVIGVLKSKGDQGWFNPDDMIVVPYSSAMKRILGQQHLNEINENSIIINSNLYSQTQEALFSVIKDRHSIYGTIENVVEESESMVWMTLSKWGILHLMRSGIIDSINESLNRGIQIRILANIDTKTINFFDKLDKRIQVRHLDNQAQMGVYVDEEVGIQIVYSETNPTGRGKADTALLIESSDYMAAQLELLKVQWNGGVDFASAKARLVDGMITEPLSLKIGEGSFYERLRKIIEKDSGARFTNLVSRRPGEPTTLGLSAASLSELGINMSDILRVVGQRIGQELALEIRNEKEDSKFWTQLKYKWEELGMGKMSIDSMPPNIVSVTDTETSDRDHRLGSVLCHMDEGVLEGILKERYDIDVTASELLCTSMGEDRCEFKITINN